MPADAVVSFPKAPYLVEDGAALGALLNTKCAEKWAPACQPEHLLQLRGKEGRSVYAIFGVNGHADEPRFIRHVIGVVAAKNFPKVLDALEADPARAPQNERQRSRLRGSILRTSQV